MLNPINSLHAAVSAVCPVAGVARDAHGAVRIDFADEATAAQRSDALAAAAAFDWQNPPPPADVEVLSGAVVALALLTLDEINLLREWVAAFNATVAAAASLADLKTRIAALPILPDRTRAQLLRAVRAKLADV